MIIQTFRYLCPQWIHPPFITFVLLPFIICCSKPSVSPSSTITLALSQAPNTLDPRTATDANGMRIGNLIFQSLVRIDKNLKIKPMLASHWTYKNKTYTFSIPRNTQFSNGRKLLKEDILFSFDQFRAPSCPFHSSFKLIKKIKIQTSPTHFILKIYLKSYSATFLNSDLPVLKILPKKETIQLGKKFSLNPIGSGDFILKKSNSNQIILESRKNPLIKQVVFKIIRDDLTRFQKVLRGEMDIIQSELPYSKIKYLTRSSLPYRLFKKDGLSMNYLLFNLKDPLFKNLEARKMIAYGINKDEIIKYKLKGFARPALSILSPKNFFYNKKLIPFPYSPTKAKEILKKRQWFNKKIKIKVSNNNEVISYAKVLARQLRQLGLKVSLESYEWGTFYGDLKKGNFQLALLRWVGAHDPDIFRIAFDSKESPPQGRNRGHYFNKRIDELVRKGKQEANLNLRYKIYSEVQEILLNELPIFPLWHNQQVSLVKNNIKSYFLPINGSYDFLVSISKKRK